LEYPFFGDGKCVTIPHHIAPLGYDRGLRGVDGRNKSKE